MLDAATWTAIGTSASAIIGTVIAAKKYAQSKHSNDRDSAFRENVEMRKETRAENVSLKKELAEMEALVKRLRHRIHDMGGEEEEYDSRNDIGTE